MDFLYKLYLRATKAPIINKNKFIFMEIFQIINKEI
jgi:hypothetical protein